MEASGPHDLRGGGVFGDLHGECADAACGVENIAAPEHVLTLGKAGADAIAHIANAPDRY